VFFLNGLNFNLVEIGIAFKTNALVFTMLGAILGGLLIKKIGIYRGFLYFSIVMACANLVYLLLALVGKSYFLMATSVAVEYFAGGLGTSAFLAMLLSLCHHSFSATQFAIFSSLDSVGRVFVGPLAGWIANDYSWALLFFISFLIGMGTTGVIWLAKNPIYRLTSLTS
jgi:PAT family beta-lactamase induction signal transducer AmpG